MGRDSAITVCWSTYTQGENKTQSISLKSEFAILVPLVPISVSDFNEKGDCSSSCSKSLEALQYCDLHCHDISPSWQYISVFKYLYNALCVTATANAWWVTVQLQVTSFQRKDLAWSQTSLIGISYWLKKHWPKHPLKHQVNPSLDGWQSQLSLSKTRGNSWLSWNSGLPQ